MAHPNARQHDDREPTTDQSSGAKRLDVLSRPKGSADIVRLFHRGDCKSGPVAAALLTEAIAQIADQPAPAVLLTGAGFTWAELPGGTARRYPTEEEDAEITTVAERAAEELRRSLPPSRPLIIAGIDVFAWPRGSEEGWAVGQFAAILPVDGGSVVLLTKRFPTGAEESYLRVPGPDDEPSSPFCDTARGRAAVLVCHDLNVYHPRSIAVTSRQDRCSWRESLTGQVEALRPTYGLHLAHYVESERSFLHGYGGWRSFVGVPLFGASGLPDDVSPDRARELAGSLLSGADGWGVLDLLERPAE